MPKSLLVLVTALIATLAFPVQGLASTTAPRPGHPRAASAPVLGKASTARDLEWAAAKHDIAVEQGQLSAGQVTAAKFSADLATFQSAWSAYLITSAQSVSQAGPAPGCPLVATVVCPSSKALSVSQYPEQNPAQYCQPGFTCYCGPSAVQTMLQFLQPKSHGGETLSQPCLAGTCGTGSPYSTKYLETNYWGGETPWFAGSGDYPVPQSINYWRYGSYSGYYAAYRPTSASDYQYELTYDIQNNYPIAGDVEEIAGKLHLPGHPTSLDIQHWIALYGYGSSGATTSYVDPAAGSALGWHVLAKNPGYSSSSIYTLVTDADQYGGPYGIAW